MYNWCNIKKIQYLLNKNYYSKLLTIVMVVLYVFIKNVIVDFIIRIDKFSFLLS